MKKNDIIQKLQEIEGNPEVFILDENLNLDWNFGGGSAMGIYNKFFVEYQDEGDATEGTEAFITLSFSTSGNEEKEIEEIRIRKKALMEEIKTSINDAQKQSLFGALKALDVLHKVRMANKATAKKPKKG